MQYRERLYITAGYSLIQCLKAILSLEDKARIKLFEGFWATIYKCLTQDLEDSLVTLTAGTALAAAHRSSVSLGARMSEILHGSRGVSEMKRMNNVERHAELLYAETLFAKVGTSGAEFVWIVLD